MADLAPTHADWRLLDGVPTAWFEATSRAEAAALAGRVVELAPASAVDVRPGGVRVRLASPESAGAVSAAGRDVGLVANPEALQSLAVVIESAQPAAVAQFWRPVLGYVPGPGWDLVDPLLRDPSVRIRESSDLRPLRDRIHLDVVRPAAVVEAVSPGEPFGPYGLCHADPDGNEVDLVPGGPFGERAETSDWQSVFSTMACYRTTSTSQQRDLAAAAAALADRADVPLLVDLRPGLVILDSGKDQWDEDPEVPPVDAATLAAELQAAARALGAGVDPGLPRLAQLVLDAADIPAVRAFWVAALGYVHDRRPRLTDIHDPRRLDPVLALQEIDAAEVERRRQRNRIHLELTVPSDLAHARLASALAAGGRLLDESAGRWRVADPEGNDLVIVSGDRSGL